MRNEHDWGLEEDTNANMGARIVVCRRCGLRAVWWEGQAEPEPMPEASERPRAAR